MNKKIKSVKLAKDYRTQFCEIKAGAVLERNVSNPEYFLLNSQTVQGVNYATTSFFERDMLDCKTGLFEIEYEEEEEHFEYPPKADSYSQGIADVLDLYYKKFLNALADWCDEKYPAFKVDIIIGYKNYEGMLAMTEAFRHYCFGTIKLNNYESASLFISELNRKENEAVREYYIELLKSGRLK